MITFEEAKDLTYRQRIYHLHNKNADGSPQRWRINGRVKLWKRSPQRIEIPIKYGMKGFDYLTENNLSSFSLHENI